MSDIVAPDPFRPLDCIRNSLIYDAGPASFQKIYCKCGRIVDFDRCGCELKKSLHKEVECSRCRNDRISRELDSLDEHYCHIESDDPLF